jgi:hypothetical protein
MRDGTLAALFGAERVRYYHSVDIVTGRIQRWYAGSTPNLPSRREAASRSRNERQAILFMR